MGCPIRKSSDQRVFAPPRRLSQRITSFIACACQGIHQLPLRHLIVHIANAHPALKPSGHRHLKRPASRDLSGGAVRLTNHGHGIERPMRRTRIIVTRPLTGVYGTLGARLQSWNPNKSSLHDVMQNRPGTIISPAANLFSQ